jgi:hypothetical protein
MFFFAGRRGGRLQGYRSHSAAAGSCLADAGPGVGLMMSGGSPVRQSVHRRRYSRRHCYYRYYYYRWCHCSCCYSTNFFAWTCKLHLICSTLLLLLHSYDYQHCIVTMVCSSLLLACYCCLAMDALAVNSTGLQDYESLASGSHLSLTAISTMILPPDCYYRCELCDECYESECGLWIHI